MRDENEDRLLYIKPTTANAVVRPFKLTPYTEHGKKVISKVVLRPPLTVEHSDLKPFLVDVVRYTP